ncbi:hypothetical protein [Herbaspirillum sp. YR522]|uniref:hypothetical protein n=1 Tax=Herbaspirillum sp. YR522 TaxID=1144342 RepID=UPI00026F53DB|nr:hypothetical protein [Herbaspirillum sp. YR522]EJN01726.1 hypothetical protein PMI40_03213 [Herbaspirillum sp. YR522]
MSEYKSTTTAYIGDPAALKDHSFREIEKSLSMALSQLSGQELVVELNNFNLIPDGLPFGKAQVNFNVAVRSQTKEVEAPF